jgi:hypothetical protein
MHFFEFDPTYKNINKRKKKTFKLIKQNFLISHVSDRFIKLGKKLRRRKAADKTVETMQNQTFETGLYEISPRLQNVIAAAYFFISLVSISGNMMIIGVVVIRKRMHNVINYFIVNMAVVDIIISIFSTPFQVQKLTEINFQNLKVYLCK